MAKMELKGFEELELKLSKLADPEITKEVVMAGAQPVADETRKSLEALPEDKFRRLKKGEVEGIKDAFLANAQSKVLLVELEDEIAGEVLKEAEKLGAAPNPVGAESKYEIVPLFYRVSGTFREADPSLAKRMIRINPNRSGADTVIRILKEAMERARKCS